MRFVVSGDLSPKIRTLSAARVLVLGFTAVGVAGCASKSGPNYAGATVAPRPVNERQWKVEIEDDGKPAQAPPVRRMRPEEDDPTQPWSPNYGGKGPLPHQSAPAQGKPRHWPAPVDASHRAPQSAQPSARLSDQDAETIIARAVNAHEMRRP